MLMVVLVDIRCESFCVIENEVNAHVSATTLITLSTCAVDGVRVTDEQLLDICDVTAGGAVLRVEIVTITNSTSIQRKELQSVCGSGSEGVLAWIPLTDYEKHILSVFHARGETVRRMMVIAEELLFSWNIIFQEPIGVKSSRIDTPQMEWNAREYVLIERLAVRYELSEIQTNSSEIVSNIQTITLGRPWWFIGLASKLIQNFHSSRN